MAAIFPNYRIAVLLGVLLNNVADITEASAWLDQLNTFVQALLGDAYQAFCRDLGFADKKHLAGIAVVLILYYGHVDIDDVAAFEGFLVTGDAVADNMVHRRTDRLRKAFVI
jgi:hypothetical protein